jgi:hypothetical protein
LFVALNTNMSSSFSGSVYVLCTFWAVVNTS